jgi:hypothetical protein
MKTLPLVCLAMAIAVVSSGITAFSFKSDFFVTTAFKERWTPAEKAMVASHTSTPATFTNLAVIDESRNILTIEEQKQLFDSIGDRFNDPASAQVRRLVRSTTQSAIICGEINAKNQFGGYVGFIPFTAGFLPKAAMVMPTKEVADQMPVEVKAQQTKMGCPDQTLRKLGLERAGATGNANVSVQLNGRVTAANYDKLIAFISPRANEIIGLNLSFENKDALHFYKSGGSITVSDGGSEVRATSGYRLASGQLIFDGYFLVKYEGMAQGEGFYELRPVTDEQIELSSKLRSVQIAE